MLSLFFLAFSNPAHAKCEGYVRKAANAKGKVVIQNFQKAYACDPEVARANFFEFMKSANDLDTLQRFTLAAIELDPIFWDHAGKIPEKIPDYSMRDDLTKNLGAECGEYESLRKFMQASYITMGGNEFNRWDEAYTNCKHEAIDSWLVERVENPPKQQFSAKYNTLLDIIAKKKGRTALSHFEAAAIAAAESGPYKDIIRKITDTVAPNIGEQMTSENREALEKSLLNIAQKVDKTKAKDVAFQLAAAGSEEKAAQLLPTIYSELYNNGFVYGVAAVELAKCKSDQKEAVIHFAELEDTKIVWSVLETATETLKGSKPKLRKCESEGDWNIVLTSTPIQSNKDIKPWTLSLKEDYEKKGYKVKLQKEKKISIQ